MINFDDYTNDKYKWKKNNDKYKWQMINFDDYTNDKWYILMINTN